MKSVGSVAIIEPPEQLDECEVELDGLPQGIGCGIARLTDAKEHFRAWGFVGEFLGKS